MSIALPYDKPGSVIKTDQPCYSLKLVEKRNDDHVWFDPPVEVTHYYPNWESSKSAVVKTVTKPSGWRPCANYSRGGGIWEYTPAYRVTKWTRTGYPKNEEKRTHYFGIDCGSVHFGDIGNPGTVHPERENLKNRVQMECMAKLIEDSVNIGTFLAEVRQSADMIANTGSQILLALRDLKRGNVAGLRKRGLGFVRRGPGNLWLNWRYGWRPMFSDFHEMWMDFMNTPNKEYLISASRTARANISGTTSKYGIDAVWKNNLRASCKIWAKIDNRLAHSATGYGLTNPLSLAWEVIPLSFAVDWFVPVGTTLSTLSVPMGLTFKDGYVNSKAEGTVSFDLTTVGSCRKNSFSFSRTKLTKFPRPRVYAMSNPFLTNQGDVKTPRVLDFLSLLSQVKK